MRIQIMSDAPNLNTGYGQNTFNLLNELERLGHDVAAVGLGFAGEPMSWNGLQVYPASSPFMMQKSIQMFKPNVVLHIRDNWIFIPKYVPQAYSLIQMCHAAGAHLINYTPVQATPLPPEFIETISTQADFTYITNKIGAEQCIKQGAPADKIGTLYNGVDPHVFRPLKVSRKNTGLPDNKKLAIFVGANMDYRKAIPVAMLGFRRYLDKVAASPNGGLSDAVLYMHTNPLGGFDLPVHIKNMGLEGHCFLKSGEGAKLMTWDLPTSEMANMYNMGDAFLSCTAAEGFNEPLLEALACGLPAVVTDTPIHREIFSCFGERVQFVKASATLPTVWAMEHQADPDDAADKLAKAFEMGKLNTVNMHMYPQFSWHNIALQFVEQAEKVLAVPFVDPLDMEVERVSAVVSSLKAKQAERDAFIAKAKELQANATKV